jgi:hypothetical protein
MTMTAGQPPAGGVASGSVRVAASTVPSDDAMRTSCRENAPAGAEAISAAAVASTTTSARLGSPVTAAKGSPGM